MGLNRVYSPEGSGAQDWVGTRGMRSLGYVRSDRREADD